MSAVLPLEAKMTNRTFGTFIEITNGTFIELVTRCVMHALCELCVIMVTVVLCRFQQISAIELGSRPGVLQQGSLLEADIQSR